MNLEEYMASFPEDVQSKLNALRVLVEELVPEAVEGMAYGMIGYKFLKKPLIYFGGFKQHIGLFALPQAHTKFSEALKDYKQGKGSVQFPLTQEIPFDLVKEIINFNAERNKEIALTKNKK